MNRFSEKQLTLFTVAGFLLVVLGFGALIYLDFEQIYAAEISDENPDAMEITDPEAWGERRWIQELQRQVDGARMEAELIAKREQDVIVYREIVDRDSKILPSEDEVIELARKIDDFARMANVRLSRVGDLNTNAGGQAIASIPFKLEISGSYDETLKFVNLFETLDRLVNVQSLQIGAGPVIGTGREAKALHQATVNLATYMYTSNAGLAKPVNIQNYERRTKDPVIQKMIRQEKAAYVEKYQLRPHINRRDPLVNPRREPPAEGEGIGPTDAALQKSLVNKLKFRVEVLKEDVRQEAQYIRERKYVPLAQIRPLIDAKVGQLELDIMHADPKITIPELRKIFHDDVVEPFEGIRAQRKVSRPVQIISQQQVREFHRKMDDYLGDRDYEAVIRQHEEYLVFVSSIKVAEDAAPLVGEMEDMRKQSQVMLDFERLNLEYTGVILQKQKGASRVIVNGRVRKEGDFIDGVNRCRLITITKDELIYEFDGFEIVDPLKAK